MFSARVRTYVSPLFILLQHLWVFSSCSEQKLLSSCGVWASHCGGFSCCRAQTPRCAGYSSCAHRLSTCSAWAWLSCGMWNLSGLGMEPVSSALARRFLTTGSTGKSFFLKKLILLIYLWLHRVFVGACRIFCCSTPGFSLVVAHRLRSCSLRPYLLQGVWDLSSQW